MKWPLGLVFFDGLGVEFMGIPLGSALRFGLIDCRGSRLSRRSRFLRRFLPGVGIAFIGLPLGSALRSGFSGCRGSLVFCDCLCLARLYRSPLRQRLAFLRSSCPWRLLVAEVCRSPRGFPAVFSHFLRFSRGLPRSSRNLPRSSGNAAAQTHGWRQPFETSA